MLYVEAKIFSPDAADGYFSAHSQCHGIFEPNAQCLVTMPGMVLKTSLNGTLVMLNEEIIFNSLTDYSFPANLLESSGGCQV